MNRRATCIVIGTMLLLAAATVRVPTRWYVRQFVLTGRIWKPSPDAPGELQTVERETPWMPSPELIQGWAWAWDLRTLAGLGGDGAPFAQQRLDWRMLIPEHAALLVLGGGLLTWVMRRERRRRAEVGR